MTGDHADDGPDRPDGPDDPQDLQDLDELVRTVRNRFVARSDAAFDFDAGLADVYARAGLPGPAPVPAGTAGDVCGRIDALASVLAAAVRPEAVRDLATSHVRRARDVLFQLRHAVATRTLSPAGAARLLRTVGDNLARAERILQDRDGMSLDDAVRHHLRDLGDLPVDTSSQLRALREQVTALLGSTSGPGPVGFRPRDRADEPRETRNGHHRS